MSGQRLQVEGSVQCALFYEGLHYNEKKIHFLSACKNILVSFYA